MSTRPQFTPYPAINAKSMASNITSDVTIIQKLSLISYQLSWLGTTPIGTVRVQGSNDFSLFANGQVNNPGTWTTLEVSVNGGPPIASIPISGNAGSGIIDILPTAIYAIRVTYIAGSGVGTMSAVVAAKVA